HMIVIYPSAAVHLLLTCLFFFSSRRRHTRWPRDWSSDVCSSDLVDLAVRRVRDRDGPRAKDADASTVVAVVTVGPARSRDALRQIGRASCRERGGGFVVVGVREEREGCGRGWVGR